MKFWKAAKAYGRKVVNKANSAKTAVVGTAVTVAASAHAALPPGADTAFTTLQADATTLSGYAYPALLAVLGFIVGFKLTKRFGNHI